MHLTDERVATAELDYLAAALRPPVSVGSFEITGQLARSGTALLYTARATDAARAPDNSPEVVLKLTGTAYAPILQRELSLLLEAVAAGIEGIIRPIVAEIQWLPVGGERAARPAAAIVLPFLSGGDLASLADRARRTGDLGPPLALALARRLGEALRGLLTELERPVVHADVRGQNVLLPASNASAGDVELIDLDAAHELTSLDRAGDDGARLLAEDVRGYGEILALFSGGTSSGNRHLDALVAECREQRITSMVDPRLWRLLADAERAQSRSSQGILASVLGRIRRR